MEKGEIITDNTSLKDQIFWRKMKTLNVSIETLNGIVDKLYELFLFAEKVIQDHQAELIEYHMWKKMRILEEKESFKKARKKNQKNGDLTDGAKAKRAEIHFS